MTDLNLAFIQTFEALKAEINRRAGNQDSHSLELDTAARRDPAVAKHDRLIRYIRDVRNTLQHPQHNTRAHALQVTTLFLDEVRGILEALENPPRACSLCVKRGDLYVTRVSDTVGSVTDVMRAKSYSHIPILDDQDKVLGVFNEAAVFDYFCSDDIIDARRDLTISEILRHCSLDANHTETFGFVRPTATADDLIGEFTTVAGTLTRVGALFVTPSGKRSEPITGMVTPWEVLARLRTAEQ